MTQRSGERSALARVCPPLHASPPLCSRTEALSASLSRSKGIPWPVRSHAYHARSKPSLASRLLEAGHTPPVTGGGALAGGWLVYIHLRERERKLVKGNYRTGMFAGPAEIKHFGSREEFQGCSWLRGFLNENSKRRTKIGGRKVRGDAKLCLVARGNRAALCPGMFVAAPREIKKLKRGRGFQARVAT